MIEIRKSAVTYNKRMVRKYCSQKVTFKLRRSWGRACHLCQGPEAGKSLVWLKD
jgi:hypothetical protein